MITGDYVLLDSKAFDEAIAKKDELLVAYNEITEEYDRIVSTLLENWKGEGADAFERDARSVRANIVSLFDIMRIMCDTIADCRQVFAECDTGLGDYNRNPS